MVVGREKLILNSLNLIAHLASLPERSDLCKIRVVDLPSILLLDEQESMHENNDTHELGHKLFFLSTGNVIQPLAIFLSSSKHEFALVLSDSPRLH